MPTYVEACAVEYCQREDKNGTAGLCSKHYARKRRGNPDWDMETYRDRGEVRGCEVPDCNEPHETDGLCSLHAQRLRRGKPMVYVTRLDFTEHERFWSKVNKNGGFVDFSDPLVRVTEADGECWIWTAYINRDGYGKFGPISAHRWGYEDEPDRDHLCRNRACVRPNHLETVGNRINVLRGANPAAVNARKTHCVHGHEFAPDNTGSRLKNGRPTRDCLTCKKMYRNPNWRDLVLVA